MPLTRRTLLLGAAGAVGAVAAVGLAVDEGWLPGEYRLRRALGRTGPAGHIPDVTPGTVVSGSFVSRDRLGTEVGWSVVYPGPRPEPLPVMVSLHGLGCDHTTAITDLGMDRFLPAAVEAGVPPFAIATVDGGTTYWHPRPNGEDAGAMVVDDLLPRLADQGLDTDKLAFQGWSMGGYGALRLAGLVGRPMVRAVAALSAALWTNADDASTSGFADAAEYRRYSVMDRRHDLEGIAVRVDCGREDPFYGADRAYVDGFDREVTATFEDGAHDAAYWTRMVPAQLAFVGRRLQSTA
ncbi:MAG TPA: alpha/beta hydrolase-fold protein [Nocardioides sp.]|jgi:enterochelin esterase-like enzyme|nr:alpha/beta hydrolase-fold protein [Nocardioides sp.]